MRLIKGELSVDTLGELDSFIETAEYCSDDALYPRGKKRKSSFRHEFVRVLGISIYSESMKDFG